MLYWYNLLIYAVYFYLVLCSLCWVEPVFWFFLAILLASSTAGGWLRLVRALHGLPSKAFQRATNSITDTCNDRFQPPPPPARRYTNWNPEKNILAFAKGLTCCGVMNLTAPPPSFTVKLEGAETPHMTLPKVRAPHGLVGYKINIWSNSTHTTGTLKTINSTPGRKILAHRSWKQRRI